MLAAALGAATIAVAIPVATAAPAFAAEAHCIDYLQREDGIIVGPKVRQACALGGSDSWVLRQQCYPLLVAAGLSDRKAERACYFASEY
ncbi:hypothetical protein [Pseudonocardia adelaidensis]|uniref:Secreted protein n=1 Tax=Pseudonocardia adelaidensis TaxID=648754 RepID=A0ABP9NIB6_9PSEU